MPLHFCIKHSIFLKFLIFVVRKCREKVETCTAHSGMHTDERTVYEYHQNDSFIARHRMIHTAFERKLVHEENLINTVLLEGK